MPNQQRKEALGRRARKYANARIMSESYPNGGTMMELANAYERGYREAIGDARRVFAESEGINSDSPLRIFLCAYSFAPFVELYEDEPP